MIVSLCCLHKQFMFTVRTLKCTRQTVLWTIILYFYFSLCILFSRFEMQKEKKKNNQMEMTTTTTTTSTNKMCDWFMDELLNWPRNIVLLLWCSLGPSSSLASRETNYIFTYLLLYIIKNFWRRKENEQSTQHRQQKKKKITTIIRAIRVYLINFDFSSFFFSSRVMETEIKNKYILIILNTSNVLFG